MAGKSSFRFAVTRLSDLLFEIDFTGGGSREKIRVKSVILRLTFFSLQCLQNLSGLIEVPLLKCVLYWRNWRTINFGFV